MISISIEVKPHQIVQMQIFPVHHSQQTYWTWISSTLLVYLGISRSASSFGSGALPILNADLEMGCVWIYMLYACILFVYILYILCIFHVYVDLPAYPWDITSLIFGVYVYTCYIYVILLVYTMNIIILFHVYVDLPAYPSDIPRYISGISL